MPDVSQEGVVSILIHEILHAYLSYNSLLNKEPINHHETMAAKFIDPMADFFQQLFGISQFDAYSLAWAGLFYTDAGNVSSIVIGGTSYSRNAINYAAATFKGRGSDNKLLAGTEQCDNN